jgi:Flp pilus assembly pilin Flp
MGQTTMNRLPAYAWSRLQSRLSDRGQTSFEYLGIAVVIAVIIGVLATTGIGTAIQGAILDAIGKISSGGGK